MSQIFPPSHLAALLSHAYQSPYWIQKEIHELDVAESGRTPHKVGLDEKRKLLTNSRCSKSRSE